MTDKPASKKMPDYLYERLFEILCRSKRGESISPEEHEFCVEMYKKYPQKYSEMERSNRFYNATKPFGA